MVWTQFLGEPRKVIITLVFVFLNFESNTDAMLKTQMQNIYTAGLILCIKVWSDTKYYFGPIFELEWDIT